MKIVYKRALSMYLAVSICLLSGAATLAEPLSEDANRSDILRELIERNESSADSSQSTIEKNKAEEDASKAQKNANEFEIPGRTMVPVVTKYPVTSSQLRNGDFFPIAIDKDVEIDGHLVFKKGTEGYAIVDKVKKHRSFGRGGEISISSARIEDVFGNEHMVQLSSQAEGDDKASAKILPIVSLAILWPLAFFAFKKGDEAVLPAGKLMFAYTTSPTMVSLSKAETP